MDIKSISASRIKTFEHCKFKYVLNYMLYECKDCLETFYTPEMFDKCCPHCKSTRYVHPTLESNWGAAHGSALHSVMEDYALAIRGSLEDGTPIMNSAKVVMLNWRSGVIQAYKRGPWNGQTNPDFAIWSLAKKKDVDNEKKWCRQCKSGKVGALCEITGETLDSMMKSGCKGCPKSLYDESVELMDGYIKRYDPILRTRKVLGIEKAFNLDFGEVDILNNPIISTGFMDLVTELDKDTIEVIDYKFGSWVPTFEEFSEDIQVKLYSLAVRRTFPQYKEYIITFDYIRKNPLSLAFTPEEDEKTKGEVIDYWKRIVGPQNIKRTIIDGDGTNPESSWKCKVMCDVKVCCREWPKFKERFNG